LVCNWAREQEKVRNTRGLNEERERERREREIMHERSKLIIWKEMKKGEALNKKGQSRVLESKWVRTKEGKESEREGEKWQR
jgi:hypothetical protein